jgi:hypothetical protein
MSSLRKVPGEQLYVYCTLFDKTHAVSNKLGMLSASCIIVFRDSKIVTIQLLSSELICLEPISSNRTAIADYRPIASFFVCQRLVYAEVHFHVGKQVSVCRCTG